MLLRQKSGQLDFVANGQRDRGHCWRLGFAEFHDILHRECDDELRQRRSFAARIAGNTGVRDGGTSANSTGNTQKHFFRQGTMMRAQGARMNGLLIPRRKLIVGGLAVPFIVGIGKSRAYPLHGSASSATDFVAQVIAGMSVGQWKRISGPAGNVVTYWSTILPFNRTNYDGYGTGAFGTFSSRGNAGLGTLSAANLFSFSKGGIDVTRYKLVHAGGGHAAYQDGSFRTFDIQAACRAIVLNQHPAYGTWKVGAMPPRLWPLTDPKPTGALNPFFGTIYQTSASGSSGRTSLSVANLGPHAAGILHWVNSGPKPYISLSGKRPSPIPAGTIVTAVTAGTYGGAGTITISNPLQAGISNVMVNVYPGQNFWAGKSTTGQTMMVSSHTYHAINPVPGTSQWLMGGDWANQGSNSQPGAGFVFDDSRSDGSNVLTDSHQGGQGFFNGANDFCDLDTTGALYMWNAYNQTLSKTNPPYPTNRTNTTLKSNLSYFAFDRDSEGIIVPDIINGGSHRMFWAHRANQTTSGGFAVILNMYPERTATYSNRLGTYTNNPAAFWSTGLEGVTYCYNPDHGYIVAFDINGANAGHIQRIIINSSLQATVADIFSRPTGDVPPAGRGTGAYPRIKYDEKHKCYIIQQAGDVYLLRAA